MITRTNAECQIVNAVDTMLNLSVAFAQVNKRTGRASTACLGVVADPDVAHGLLTVKWDDGSKQQLSPQKLDHFLLRSKNLVGHTITPVRTTFASTVQTPAMLCIVDGQGLVCKGSGTTYNIVSSVRLPIAKCLGA
jgi:hypothetical protein